MKNEIENFGLDVYFKDEEHHNSDDFDDYNSMPIYIEICEGPDTVATICGTDFVKDIDVECEHPECCRDWGDDDECGECLLCGDQCTWRWVEGEEYEGVDEYGNVESSKWGEREINEWHSTDNKGLIGKLIEELKNNGSKASL